MAVPPSEHPDYAGRELDAGGLKALAHPLRLRLLRLLSLQGPSTASDLGRAVGESSGTTSYHLRKLAEHGLLEEAADMGTGRDRYWRRTQGPLMINSEAFRADDATRGPVTTLLDNLMAEQMAELREWRESGNRWPEQWYRGAEDSSLLMHLTAEEMQALRDELVGVVVRWLSDRMEPAEGTRAVHVGVQVFPIGPPPPSHDADDGPTG